MKTIAQVYKHPNTRQTGFTLVEVMVALVIFSVGLLGLAGMQMTGLQSNHSAMMRTIATQQSYDMAERIRSNRIGNYIVPSINSIEGTDFTNWDNMNQALLPSGVGQVRARAGGGLTVRVFWDENNTGASQTNNCPPTSDPKDMQCAFVDVTP